VEAWITFETGAARGYGHLRLRNGKCWTLLTTMQELKGFEEKKGVRREKSVAHEIIKGRRSWLEQKEEREARLGYEEQPYTVIIGGGQGGIASARGCGAWACPPSSSRRMRSRATPGATATSRCTCTTPSGTTTCPT
jgi:hypothetical protein